MEVLQHQVFAQGPQWARQRTGVGELQYVITRNGSLRTPIQPVAY